MATPAWTPGDLATINKAIATGALEVKYADRTVKYRDLEEMLQIRDLIEGEIAGAKPPRQVVVVPRSGFL